MHNFPQQLGMKQALILLFAASLLFTTGCGKRGCVDVESENYDPTATQDDGTCAYPSDRFAGYYLRKDTVQTIDTAKPDSLMFEYNSDSIILFWLTGKTLLFKNWATCSDSIVGTVRNDSITLNNPLLNCGGEWSDFVVVKVSDTQLRYTYQLNKNAAIRKEIKGVLNK